jgi:hypothetical protein
MLENFDDIKVGDEVIVSRGRSPRRLGKVYKVTPKTFDVEGNGKFWKHNGKGHGDADSWDARYCYHIQPGDRRRENENLFSGCRVRDLHDTELETIAKIIRACNRRHAKRNRHA